MTFAEAEAAYKNLKKQLSDGSMRPDEFHEVVYHLRLQDRNGNWWQIDPNTGYWLRWTGSQWEPDELPTVTPKIKTGSPEGFINGRVAFCSFFGLFILALILWNFPERGDLSLILLLITGISIVFFRSVLRTWLQAFDRLTLLRPVWKLHIRLPRGLRFAGGFVVPMLLGHLLALRLSGLFGGYGVMMLFVSLVLNTLVAHFFFGPAPDTFMEGRT